MSKRDTITFGLLFCFMVAMPVHANYPMFQHDPMRTGRVNEGGPITNATTWEASIGGLIASSPVVSDGKVFVSNWYAEWSGGVNGLYCLNESNGEILWNNSLGGNGGASTAAVVDNRVFVGSFNGEFYCINKSSGETIVSKKIENNPDYWGIASSPLIYEDKVFVTTFSDGTLHVFDFDGNELWNFSTGNPVHWYVSPAAMGDAVFFIGNASKNAVFAIDIFTHGEIWNFSLEEKITTTPTIWDNSLILATDDKLYTLNISNGDEFWSNPFSSKMSSPAVDGGKLYIGSDDGNLYCYDIVDGSLIWNFSANGPVYSSPVVADGVIYFGTNTKNGTIYALNASDGSLIWKYVLHPPDPYSYYTIMSSPAIADGILFVGADDGKVRAFVEGNYTPPEPPSPPPSQERVNVSIRVEGKLIHIVSCNLTLMNGTVNVTAISGKNYSINNLTVLGALDKASKLGGFNYTLDDAWYDSWGALLVKSIGNSSDWWHYWVNYTLPMVGANSYTLNEDDYVLWGYAETWTPSPLRASLSKDNVLVDEEFTVDIESSNGSVWNPAEDAIVHVDSFLYSTDANGVATISLVDPGSYQIYAEKDECIRSERRDIEVKSNTPDRRKTYIHVDVSYQFKGDIFPGEVHYENGMTAFEALQRAAEEGGFSYKYRGDSPDTYYVYSIAGHEASGAYGWLYWVNYPDEPLPVVSAGSYELEKDDYVVWFWGTLGSRPPGARRGRSRVTTTTTSTTSISTTTSTTTTTMLPGDATTSTTSISTTTSTTTTIELDTANTTTTTTIEVPKVTGKATGILEYGTATGALFLIISLVIYAIYKKQI